MLSQNQRRRPILSLSPLFLISSLLLLTFPSPATSQSQTPSLQILNASGAYAYAGCWNETSSLPDTDGLRALSGGIDEVLPGSMTVAACADFCANNDTAHGPYELAGLEYSRECWCADSLDALSVRLDDAACDDACDGDNSTACGGALRISLYNRTERDGGGGGGGGKSGKQSGAAGRWSLLVPDGGGGLWGGIGIGGLVMGLGLVVGIL